MKCVIALSLANKSWASEGKQIESAKFWQKLMNELNASGVNNILIAAADSLKDFLNMIPAALRDALVPTCVIYIPPYVVLHRLWHKWGYDLRRDAV